MPTIQPSKQRSKATTKLFLLSPNALNQADLERNTIKVAAAIGVEQVVKLSVLDTEAEDYGFGRVHRVAKKAIEASNKSWTLLRASRFMQILSSYMGPSIRGQNAIPTGCGNGKLTHLDIQDIATAAAHVLTESRHSNTSKT